MHGWCVRVCLCVCVCSCLQVPRALLTPSGLTVQTPEREVDNRVLRQFTKGEGEGRLDEYSLVSSERACLFAMTLSTR